MRCSAVVSALVVIAACGAKKRDDRKEDQTARRAPEAPVLPAPSSAVALLRGTADDGTPGLFQLDPRTGLITAVAAVDNSHVSDAAVARDGSGGATALRTERGDRGLYRWRARVPIELERASARNDLRDALAVSRDGAVIASSTDGQVLVVVGADGKDVASIDMKPLGRKMYPAAMSLDGSKLAFSTMKPECASPGRGMEKCPVTLWVIDLSAPGGAARKLAGGGAAVAYSPQFLGETGDQLIYLSNEGDPGPACRASVNDCRYQIRSQAFTGGPPEVIAEDAVIGRMAGDGMLAYRRLQRPGEGPRRSWTESTLIVKPAGGEPAEIAARVAIWTHEISPDSQMIAVVLWRDNDRYAQIIDREGQPVTEGIAAQQLIPIGWSAVPFAAGVRTPKLPGHIAALARAVGKARAVAGSAPIAVVDVRDSAYERLDPRPKRLDRAHEIDAWLDASPDGLLVVSRFAFCNAQDADGLEPIDAVDDEFVIARRRSATPADTPQPSGKSLARFATADDGAIDLLDVDMPETARRGSRFRMTLHWRVLRPPPPAWKVFVHFDGNGHRFQADHIPGICGPRHWKAGQTIVDTFEVQVAAPGGDPARGSDYRAHLGWFAHSARAEVRTASVPVADGRVQVGIINVR